MLLFHDVTTRNASVSVLGMDHAVTVFQVAHPTSAYNESWETLTAYV